MKAIKLLTTLLITFVITTSCTYTDESYYEDPYQVSLEEVITDYDLWYVDYHRTTGNGDVPFLSKAFTISFINGALYANNNIVDIGVTGNGYGIKIGTYDTYSDVLEIDHILDAAYDFDVIEVSGNEIALRSLNSNVTYYLEGHQKNSFDYDQVFYENIEYFLQEYTGWEKTYVSDEGTVNDFDNENYLAFTPENITTFYSSEDEVGIDIDSVIWDFEGDYEIFDVEGYENLKIVTLDYDQGYNEEFELVVLNDGEIELYHVESGTTYAFTGRDFIQYLKSSKGTASKTVVRSEGRKRTKVERKTKVRKKH